MAMPRRGWQLGREQTRRLMRKAGLRGVHQGKPVFTTVTDPADQRPADLVNRQFSAPAPNRLWVAGITYARTWRGSATPLSSPTSALARSSAGPWPRRCAPKIRPCGHSNMLSGRPIRTCLSWCITATAGRNMSFGLHRQARRARIAPSVGSRGDSYDNALAETVNAAYRAR